MIAGHRVLAHLNRGLDLDVWEVWDERRACRCVAKTIAPGAARGTRARLLREGRLLRRLAHPHLVRGYEVHERPAAVVLETLDGATVSWMVREGGIRLTARDLAYLGAQLASAVAYLHAEGWLHLDLKPSNVICDAGHAKVIDLSLARRPGPAPAGAGTAQYLAPEQARGEPVGPPADVFGIGATLWAAAAAARPFAQPAPGQPFEQASRRAEPIGRRRRLPRALAGLIDACLEPAPERRPAVREILAGCEALT
jgi:eukaryotic-like serine/threonine-protein kinase